MIGDFSRILPFTLKWECGNNPRNPRGNVDIPGDYGGRTSRGVTQKSYDFACTSFGWPQGDVWIASDEQIEIIYQRNYWNRVEGDEIGWPLCGALFDSVVLHTLPPLIERLQVVIGTSPDGQLGSET